MKKLSQFTKFLFAEFSAGKIYRVTRVYPWVDYETKKPMGTKVDVVIAEDNTQYDTKGGESVTNQYERLTFKVRKDVEVSLNARVMPVNPVATVYGEYRNKLAVTADDIRVIVPQKTVEQPKIRL